MRAALTAAIALTALSAPNGPTLADGHAGSADLGPRPALLVDALEDGELKEKLEACLAGPFQISDFSIGHRGAPMMFPEHTRQSYEAAAHMGAGILECDVAFTADKELVCRHSQCDLHQTTNILETDLAAKCSAPFTPADGDTPASANCCTSDITLAEYKSLEGKMDAFDATATTVEDAINATAAWRTDLYADHGDLMSLEESIALFETLGRGHTPELKTPSVDMPYDGYSQEDYAQAMVDAFVDAGVDPTRVWLQSFNLEDVVYWIENAPEFGAQAVYLDDSYNIEGWSPEDPATWEPSMAELKEMGVNILAPPTWVLVKEEGGAIVPSTYAQEAKAAGLELITWTLERSGRLSEGGGWYYQTIAKITDNDGVALELLDVLAQDVGVLGVFSDWPATTTFYANCMDLG